MSDAPSDTLPEISVILLNWKGADDTIDCIRSLCAPGAVRPRHIMVVENLSGDGSAERIAQACAESGIPLTRLPYTQASHSYGPLEATPEAGSVVMIEADGNLGFCVGNNVGAEWALAHGADATLILNNDTTVDPDMIPQLAAAAATLGPRVLISPQILYEANPDTVWWCGGAFSSVLSPTYRHQGEKRQTGITGFPESQWVSGCATLISKTLFEEIGLYDPTFFIWCEEWDLSLRATSKGIALRVAPEAIVYHKVGKSLGIVSPLTFFYSMRNMILLRRRYMGLPKRAAFNCIYLPKKAMQAVQFAVKYRSRRYLEAFVDALGSPGGIWGRQ